MAQGGPVDGVRVAVRTALRRLRAIGAAGYASRGAALRIGLGFALPMTIAVALGHPVEGAIATQGAFVAPYARDEPYRRRLRIMIAIGLAIAAAVALGTVASASPVATVLGVGLVAGLTAIGCLAWDVGLPREFFVVLSFLAATRFPGGLDDVPLRVALVVGGSALVIAVAMLPALWRPRGPEERALLTFYDRLATLLESLGDRDDVADARRDTLVAVETARQALQHATRNRQQGDRLVALALAAEPVMDAALGLVQRDSGPIDPGWAAAVRQIRDSVRDPDAARETVLPDDPPGTIHGERFARMMRRAVAAADPVLAVQTTFVPFGRRSPRRGRAVLRRALRPGSLVVPTALRVGIAVAAGTAIGLAIDEQRGIWVGLTTSAVLQASNVNLTAQRTVQRAMGTIAGVGVAALILVFEPGAGVLVLCLAVCQVVVQATVRFSYAFGIVFATPIALLTVDLGQPGTPAGSLVALRVEDTLLGCAVGLLARRLLWPRTAATGLGSAQAAAIEAVRDVLHAALTRAEAPTSERIRRARRALHTALLNLDAVQQDAVGDLVWSTRGGGERLTVTSSVQRLAFTTMGVAAPQERTPPARAQVQQLDAALGAMAAIASGLRAPALVPVPPLDGYPATHRALVELRDALRGGRSRGAGDGHGTSASGGAHRAAAGPTAARG